MSDEGTTRAALLPCLLCEKLVKPREPFRMVAFLMRGDPDLPGLGNAPVHLVCEIQAAAGEAARAIHECMRTGQIVVGVDREDGESLADVVGEVIGNLVEREMRPRRRR